MAILKPDCLEKKLVGTVVARIEAAGFTICGMRMVALTPRDVAAFYAAHRTRPFFSSLTGFMARGPVVVLALEKEDAVQDFRELIGATDPAQAAPGTVRREYASSKGENVVHGSDSVASGKAEIAFFFAARDLLRT